MSDPTHKLFVLTPISEEASGDAKNDPGFGWLPFVGQGRSPPPNRRALMRELQFVSNACEIVEFIAAVDVILGDTPTSWSAMAAESD